jgi:hypothetical protein
VAKVGTRPGAEAIAKLNELVVAVAPLMSVTVTVIGKMPAWVGVPDSTAPVSVTPVGKVLEVENVLGVAPPSAVIVKEKAELTVPDKPFNGVVIVSAGATLSETALEVVEAVVPFSELVTTTA